MRNAISSSFACILLASASAIGAGPPGPARPELPPGSYDKLRKEATEALIIDVLAVETRDLGGPEVEVSVTARVLGVERSDNHVSAGDRIRIVYIHIDLNKVRAYAGSRPTPILEKGRVYPAFLKQSGEGTHYAPVAAGESFHMMPEL